MVLSFFVVSSLDVVSFWYEPTTAWLRERVSASTVSDFAPTASLPFPDASTPRTFPVTDAVASLVLKRSAVDAFAPSLFHGFFCFAGFSGSSRSRSFAAWPVLSSSVNAFFSFEKKLPKPPKIGSVVGLSRRFQRAYSPPSPTHRPLRRPCPPYPLSLSYQKSRDRPRAPAFVRSSTHQSPASGSISR